jgi:endonuclease YncB( thermonuclease family)
MGGGGQVNSWIVGGLACVSAVLATSPAWTKDPAPCSSETVGVVAVQATLDGRTLLLKDGRELRLAGIEVPPTAEARSALAVLADGRELTLARLGPEADRYGRVSALAVPAEGDRRSIQVVLLAQGNARVSFGAGDCAAAFQAAEQQARGAGLGLWADPAYLIRSAGNAREIQADRGRFAVVEGRVVSVRESAGTIYVNFSRNWAEDFTVTVPKRSERRFSAVGLDLKNLVGRRVRVRGTVEERGGPWIEATRPEQIELAGRD